MSSFLNPNQFPTDFFPPRYFGASGGLRPPNLFIVDLVAYLQTHLSVIKFYPGKIPQQLDGGYPAVSYLMVDGDDEYLLSGEAGIARDQIQFDCWSADPVGAFAAAEALRKALLPKLFPMTMGTTRVLEANRHPRLSGYDAGVDGSDDGYHRVMNEWTFIYRTT